jgi:O-antigen ligase
MLVFITVNMVMVNDRGVETALPWVLGLSLGLNAALASIGYFLGVEYFIEGGRGYSGTISANIMALMCVFGLPLMVYWLIYGGGRLQRLFGLALTFLMVAGLVSTESRGGFLNLIAVSGLLLIQFRHHFQPKYLGLVVGGLSALLFAFVAFVPQEYIQRQASLELLVEWVSGDGQELARDGALDRRAAYLEVAADVFPQRPILGSGTDTFQEHWVDSMQTRWFDMEKRPAHNTYVEVLIGSGLLGFAAFGALLWITYRNYRAAEDLLRAHGDEKGAHLAGAYKLAFLAILIYFFVKSGLDHKYFLLALPLSDAVRRYAEDRVRRIVGGESVG